MKAKDLVPLFLLAAVWGASFLFMRIGTPEFGPVVLVQLRMLIAAVFLMPILVVRVGFRDIPRNWKTLTLLGACNSAIPFLLLSYATLHVSAGFSSIVNATAPLWGVAIAWLWLSDRPNRTGICGLLVGFAGVVILTADSKSLVSPDSTLALGAAVGGAFFYGVGVNYAKRYTNHLSSLTTATGSMLLPGIVLTPLAVAWWPESQPSLVAWASVVGMGVMSTGFAYILYFRLIANVGPSKAITVAYLIPVFAVVWGALILDEKITAIMVVGCAIIFLGTALVTGVFPRAQRQSESHRDL